MRIAKAGTAIAVQYPLFVLSALLLFQTSLWARKIERIYPPDGPPAGIEVVAGEVIVKFNAAITPSGRSTILAAKGAFVRPSSMEAAGWNVVKLPKGRGVAAALTDLRATEGVISVEPNIIFRLTRTPNDWYLKSQGYLEQIKAFGGWEYETGASSRVTVAVMDTGIDSSHYELSGKLVSGSMFFDPYNAGAASAENSPGVACSHGTGVASVAAAATDNGLGMAAIGWNVRLLSLRIFPEDGCFPDCPDATCFTDTPAMLGAVNYVRSLNNSPETGRIILNMSLGAVGEVCNPALALPTALTAAVNEGILVVVSAGNDGDSVNFPANCPDVLPVGAVDSSDAIAYFSSRGAPMTARGVVAPGVGVFAAKPGASYGYYNGTSFAAPLVSGLGAIMWASSTTLTAAQLAAYLRASADDLGAALPDNTYGWGRINAYKAMYMVQNGSLAGLPAEPPAASYSAFRTKVAAFPNPFRPGTHPKIDFAIPPDILGEEINVTIYTAEGEIVKKLGDGTMSWDGKNEAGAPVASGIYMFRVKTDKDSVVGKFALIR